MTTFSTAIHGGLHPSSKPFNDSSDQLEDGISDDSAPTGDSENQVQLTDETKEANSFQPFSIHKIQLDKIEHLAEKSLKPKTIKDLEDLIENMVYIYNKTIKNSGMPDYVRVDIKNPDWDQSVDPPFNLRVYRQVITAKTKVSIWCEKLGAVPCVSSRAHYLFAYFRMHHSRPEIFALTTGDGWRTVHRWSDFTFPVKMARRLLEMPDKKNKRILLGNVLTVSEILKKGETNKIDELAVLFTRITSKFRPTSSICRLPYFQTKKNLPIVRGMRAEIGLGLFRFCKHIPPENFPAILDHMSTIDRGGATFPYEGKKADPSQPEEDSEVFDFLEYLQPVPFNMIEGLNQALENLVWEAVQGKRVLALDFCHKYTSDYFHATSFSLSFKSEKEAWGGPLSTSEMIDKLKAIPDLRAAKDLDQFRTQLAKVTVAFNRGGKMENAPFTDYFEGEFYLHEGVAFWRVRTMWYQVSADYLGEVHRSFGELLQSTLLSPKDSGHLSLRWPSPQQREKNKKKLNEEHQKTCPQLKDKQKCTHVVKYNIEAEYNERYLDEKSFLLGDRICPQAEHIELFDILFFDDKRVFLYHVKEGFGQTTRDVCSQIITSAKLIRAAMRDKDASTNILKSFYQEATQYKQNKKNSDESYRTKAKNKLLQLFKTEQDFLNLFLNREVIFVCALIDDRSGQFELNTEKNLKTRVTVEDIKASSHKKVREKAAIVFEELKKQHYITQKGRPSAKFLLCFKKEFKIQQLVKAQCEALYDDLKKFQSGFDSTIAKLELLRLKDELNTLGFQNFKICQIQREDYSSQTQAAAPAIPSAPTMTIPAIPASKPPSLELGVGKTVSLNGNDYLIKKTEGDGACGLHALWGVDKDGRYIYEDDDESEDANASARNHFLELMKEKIKIPEIRKRVQGVLYDFLQQMLSGDPTFEANLVYKNLKEYQGLKAQLARIDQQIQAKRQELDPLFKSILEDKDKPEQLLDTLKATSSAFKKLSHEALCALLLADAQKRRDAFLADKDNILNLFEPDDEKMIEVTAIIEETEQMQKGREARIMALAQSKEVFESYKVAFTNPLYYLTDPEVGIAAIMSEMKVTILGHDVLDKCHPPISYGAGNETIIFHKGNHYSHCELQVPAPVAQ